MSIYNWKGSGFWSGDSDSRRRVQRHIRDTNWDELCQYASRLNRNVPCHMLPDMTSGLRNLVRLLEFDDGTRWIARIRMSNLGDLPAMSMQSEVDVMSLVRARTDIPVPNIFGFEIDDANPVGAPFILMEFLPGTVAMDADGGWDAHHGRIPELRRPGFYSSVADAQVQLTSLRFSKIGTIVKGKDDRYDTGPFPDIGGPFDTATAFFEAWAEHAQFPMSTDQIRQRMNGGPVNEVLNAINKFPSRVKELAHSISASTRGPFPVVHTDFFHSNIVIDHSYGVIGIIDWEGACTLPWELVEFPLFLVSIPALFDAPWNYDEHGEPLDADQKLTWKERRGYISTVRQVESLREMDSKLSSVLDNQMYQSLAYAMRVFLDPGKLGFYDKVTQEFGKQE